MAPTIVPSVHTGEVTYSEVYSLALFLCEQDGLTLAQAIQAAAEDLGYDLQQAWRYTPLTTSRLCRSELKQLALEIRRSEKVDQFTAEKMALAMMDELEEYRDDWDRMCYLAGNHSTGLPF